MSVASSSMGPLKKDGRSGKDDVAYGSHGGVPAAVSDALTAGVSKLGMNNVPPMSHDTNLSHAARVSGLNSFMGSSDGSEKVANDSSNNNHMSMRDRLLLGKNNLGAGLGEKKTHSEVKIATKEIVRQNVGRRQPMCTLLQRC